MEQQLSIEQIDPNFASATVDCSDVEFFSPRVAPMQIHGLLNPEAGGPFHRLPHPLAKQLNPRIEHLNLHTAGGRIRFKTNAQKIVIKSILPFLEPMKHMPLTGSACFDMYVDGHYVKPFMPNFDIFDAYSADEKSGDVGFYAFHEFKNNDLKEIELGFPLYNPVDDVFIGLSKGAEILPPTPYQRQTPVVFYGSSITQGGCASHPGNSYQAILSRRLNCDYVNLGFSGNAKGDLVLAEYIGALKMSAFVMDYDHNAMHAEHLAQTHEPFFKAVRAAQPELPIVLVSVADDSLSDKQQRREVILNTYCNALAAGDKNVYFVDGTEIYREVGVDLCTVDHCHPNDLGFWCMANAIEKPLAEILK